MTIRKKKILGVLLAVTVLFAGAAYYFTQTAQGGAYMLYTFAGAHAPLSLKYSCGKETNRRVDAKFELPLLIDDKSKDGLRGFWYYSYFRECLHRSGFDFSGNSLHKSALDVKTDYAVYTNPQGNFTLLLPKEAVLHEDNTLDVDNDDRLLVSRIGVGGHTLHIRTYLNDDDIQSFKDLEIRFTHFSGTNAEVETQETVVNQNGVSMLVMRQNDGNHGFVFVTPELHIVHVYGLEELSLAVSQARVTVQRGILKDVTE